MTLIFNWIELGPNLQILREILGNYFYCLILPSFCLHVVMFLFHN